jgi:hypothetical protein
MRRKLFAAFALSALSFSLAATAPRARDAQQSNQNIVDDFINSRGLSFGQPQSRPKPKRRPPTPGGTRRPKAPERAEKSKPADSAGNADTNAHAPAEGGVGEQGGVADSSANMRPGAAQPIGLGYTVLLRGADGQPLAADESKEFKVGDRIRVKLETNTDGYLYIFTPDDDGTPLMIYPHAAVDGGANTILANTNDFVPVADWYALEPPAADVPVYVILSRKPFAEVKTGEALVEFCGGRRDCYWKPTPAAWERIKAASATSVIEGKNLRLARVRLPDDTLTRGLRLSRESPGPAVVRVSSSAEAQALMTTITLISK